MHYLSLLAGRRNEWNIVIRRTRFIGIKFLPSSFLGHDKERCAFPPIILDRAIPSLNSGETAIAVAKSSFVRIEKAFWVGNHRCACVRIFPTVIPHENAPTRHHGFRIGLVSPEVDKITPVTQPLIKNA